MKKSKLLAILACFVLFIAPLSGCGDKLSIKNYDKIECVTTSANGGMTIEKVKEILGEPDEIITGAGMDIVAEIYVWGSKERNIKITFLEGKAISKTQIGLD